MSRIYHKKEQSCKKQRKQEAGGRQRTGVLLWRAPLLLAAAALFSAAALGGCQKTAGQAEQPAPAAESEIAGGDLAAESTLDEQAAEASREAAEQESREAAEELARQQELYEYVSGPDIGVTQPYLDGASLTLAGSADGGQNLSCLLQTEDGAVIVVDGGREADAGHLTQLIQERGGKVDVWLLTHPHNDHVGALTEILNEDPVPVEIGKIYYHFLDREVYEQGENQGRMADYDNLMTAFEKIDAEKLCTPLYPGQQIETAGARITVLNEPFSCEASTFNNSSVGYRIEMGGKRILFLGDMGYEAGDNLLAVCSAEELKADVVQMSHHGQAGVSREVYEVIAPEVCLWPTPQWLWDNELDGVPAAGPYATLEVRAWMKDLGVKQNLTIRNGDETLR